MKNKNDDDDVFLNAVKDLPQELMYLVLQNEVQRLRRFRELCTNQGDLIKKMSQSIKDIIEAIPLLEKQVAYRAKLSVYLTEFDKIQQAVKADSNLASGRLKGTEIRKKKAAEKYSTITKSIADLYANGKQMTYKEIANYFVEKTTLWEGKKYTFTTMHRKVKEIAPAIKAKYKSGE